MGCVGSGQCHSRIIFVGLDNAGKSSILYYLKYGQPSNHQRPTIGYQQETITRSKMELQIWDVSGDCKGRDLWRHYVKDAHALVFVIDSSDEYHLDSYKVGEESAKNELHRMLKELTLPRMAPLLIYANKQDKSNALGKEQIEKRLDLKSIKHRQWHIQTSCALKGNGIEEGIEWLTQTLQNQIKQRKKGK